MKNVLTNLLICRCRSRNASQFKVDFAEAERRKPVGK